MLSYILKIIKINLSISYHILRYKLNFNTYNDTVINICNSLISHSYIFIKVIQWGIQNVYDLNFDHELKQYFNTFSNNVPYTNFEQERAILLIDNAIEYASRSCNDKLVIENNYVPINSGSVSLVYKAHLNDKSVVIKVLKHNIKKNIEKDIYFLVYFFDNAFVKMILKYYTIIVNFKIFIENNRDLLLNQCDFELEVNNALLFKNNLKNKKNIVIPHVYKHFTDACNEIIIMDYLDGPVAKNVPPYQLQKHFEQIRSLFFESVFRYNTLHGDFHLGNIIIVNENTIGIIDFGIVYTVTNEISNGLFDILILNVNKNKIKYFLHAIKIFIKMICINEKDHEEIFIKFKNDDELINIFLKSKFSGSVLVTTLNKIISMDGVELNVYMSNLFLSLISTLQTLDNSVSLIDDSNKSLTIGLKTYIKL